MSKKDTRGRKMQSDNFKVIPEFKDEPDIDKLGLALIAIAKDLAEKKLAAEAENDIEPRKENDMT